MCATRRWRREARSCSVRDPMTGTVRLIVAQDVSAFAREVLLPNAERGGGRARTGNASYHGSGPEGIQRVDGHVGTRCNRKPSDRAGNGFRPTCAKKERWSGPEERPAFTEYNGVVVRVDKPPCGMRGPSPRRHSRRIREHEDATLNEPGRIRLASLVGGLVVGLLSVGISCAPACAATPIVSILDIRFEGQDSATLPITVTGFTELNSLTISLHWDQDVVAVTAVEEGDLGGFFLSGDPQIEDTIIIAWIKATPPLISDGVLADITVVPLQKGTSGLDVTVVTASMFSGNGENIEITEEVTASGGTVTVSELGATSEGGDTNVQDGGSSSHGGNTDSDVDAQCDNPFLVWAPADSRTTSKPSTEATLRIAPAQVLPNQETAIIATICNTGAEAAARVVALMVGGALDQSQSVSVAAGTCKEIRFNVSRSVPGTYQVAIDNLTGEFSVLPAAPSPPATTDGDLVPEPETNSVSPATILAIIGTMLILIAALVFFFRKA